MTAMELINILKDYPGDWPIMIEVKGQQAFATDVDMEVSGAGAWLTITDYPISDDNT